MKSILIFYLILFISPVFLLAQEQFLVKPYLQIGYQPNDHSLVVLWHTIDSSNNWNVEYKTNNEWINAENIEFNYVNVKKSIPFRVYHALFKNLISGIDFEYRIFKNKVLIFSSIGKAPKNIHQSYSFAVMGDIGAETKNQKKLANLLYSLNPDFVAVPGDIVYNSGLISDYTKKYWPIYNNDYNDTLGAPIIRKIPFIAAVGNHDAEDRDLDITPNALAYYYFWEQPLNGPNVKEGGTMVPFLKGSNENKNAFYTAAGKAYPNMINFSYDYGNAHWTVIDADTYVDWTDTTLLNWVKNDIKNAVLSKWHFVMFHHPGFNSSRAHYEQQHMRLLSPIFEAGKVDVVFNGHVHNYQRTFPMTFTPDKQGTLMVGGKENKTIRGRVVNGRWNLDKIFDGKVNKDPRGVIYVITGAGGNELYNPEQTNDPDSWQKFTYKFHSLEHSLSYITIDDNKFNFKQILANGKVIDEFEIVK